MGHRDGLDQCTYARFHRAWILFGRHSPVQTKCKPVRDHIGIDAAVEEANDHGRMVDALHLRFPGFQRVGFGIDCVQDGDAGAEGVATGLRHGAMPRLAVDGHLELQAPVVRRHDCVAEARGDRKVRLRELVLEKPPRPGQAPQFLVVREMELHDSVKRGAARVLRAQCRERISVRRNVGLRNGDTAPVHAAILYHAPVGRFGPPLARRHDVAVRV